MSGQVAGVEKCPSIASRLPDFPTSRNLGKMRGLDLRDQRVVHNRIGLVPPITAEVRSGLRPDGPAKFFHHHFSSRKQGAKRPTEEGIIILQLHALTAGQVKHVNN